MDIDPKFMLKLISSGEDLKRLKQGPLIISTAKSEQTISMSEATALMMRGTCKRSAAKGRPQVRITEFGEQMLWYAELFLKAETLTARFKPCEACKRRDGTHSMMCPVGLGIMKDRP